MALRTTTRNRITNRDKWTFRWLQINDVNSYTNILELTVEFIRYGSYNQSDHATNHATKIIYTIPSNRILYSIAKQDDLISIRRSSLIQHHNHRRLWFDIVTIISPSINSTYYGTRFFATSCHIWLIAKFKKWNNNFHQLIQCRWTLPWCHAQSIFEKTDLLQLFVFQTKNTIEP